MGIISQNNNYIIYYTNLQKQTITIPAQSLIENILDVTLIGKSTLDYGALFDENILHLAENFACPQSESALPTVEPDLTQIADDNWLYQPTEGEFWFNKTESRLYVYNILGEWQPIKLRNDVTATSGIIAHGQQIPLPSGATEYSQCSWFVSPQYVDQPSNYIACYTDANANVTMQYRPSNYIDLVDGLANYIIFCSEATATQYKPVVSITPTLTPANPPFSSVSPTPTPTSTPAAAVTLTPTPSVTASITPSVTASMTMTPTMTRSITPSPTVSVTPSAIVSQSFTLTAQTYIYNASLGYSANGFLNLPQEGYYNIGSITPATYNGYLISGLYCYGQNNVSPGLAFYLPVNTSATVFSKIQFNDQFGIFRTFTSASATVLNSIYVTSWLWQGLPAFLFNPGSQYIITIYF